MNGFVNNNFNADGSVAAGTSVTATTSLNGATGAITAQLTAGAFDGAYSVGVSGGWVSNLGITYASNTLSVTGATAALSAANPGYVIMQDKSSPGLLKKYTVIANQGFLDDTGASEIIGNRFGLITGVAYAEDIPFFIYAVTNDAETEIAFMCSRVPSKTTSPVVANIGDPSAATADEQYAFFSFDDITEADYESNPCVCIGSFRMRMSASDDWTVQALSINDGIGLFNETTAFSYPSGVFENATGTYLKDNGGTAPFFTDNFYKYTIDRTGTFKYYFVSDKDGGTDGAGAVNSIMMLPYRMVTLGSNIHIPVGSVISAGGTDGLLTFQGSNGSNQMILLNSASIALTNSNFSAGNRTIRGMISFDVRLS